ncbi:signaling lymphocytic activation molecule-like isoform 2-T2 [Anomaloglossus baeobatrachus]
MAVFLFVVFCMFFCHFGGSNLCGNTKMILNGTLGNSLVLYKLNSNPNYAMLYLKYTNYTSKKKLLEHNFDSSKEDHQSNLNSNYQFKKIDSSVVIQKLQNDDERDYELTVEKKDEFEDVCHIEVKVYEQISSLTVVVTEDSQNNTCRVIMKCLMQTGTNVTFSWMRDEEILSNDGSTLEISITKQNANSTFQCTAKNPVSEKSSQYILSSACNPDHGMSSKPFGHLQSSPQSRPPAPEPVSEQTNEVTHTLYSTVQKPQIRHVYEAASNSQPFSSVYELAGPCRDDAQSQTIRNEETRV